MRRSFVVLMGLSLLVAACGGDGSVLAPGAGETGTTTATTAATADTTAATDTTAADLTDTTASHATTPPTTPTTDPPLARPGLSVHQVLVRYDGISGAGTFEATVCNLEESGEIQPDVAISANGIEVSLSGISIPPMSCRVYFDATADLPAFGVLDAGVVAVGVTATPGSDPAEAVSITAMTDVPSVTVQAPADQLQSYRDCLASGQNHRNCVGNVPHHPIPDVGEVMKVRDRFMAIGPGPEEVLSFFVADNATCTPRIESWMGTTGPTPIAHRVVVADDYSGAYTGRPDGIYSIGSQERWDDATLDVSGWWRDVINGHCDNSHELTHLILGDTPMPSLIEEGLATYMEADARSGSGEPPSAECRENGWFGWRFEDGQGERPFEDLDAWDPNVYGIFYYYTGMCFWDYLANEYGESIVQDIVGATAAYRDTGFNGCMGLTGTVLFMEDIVTPILGADISPVTEQKFGFGSTFTGCEGV